MHAESTSCNLLSHLSASNQVKIIAKYEATWPYQYTNDVALYQQVIEAAHLVEQCHKFPKWNMYLIQKAYSSVDSAEIAWEVAEPCEICHNLLSRLFHRELYFFHSAWMPWHHMTWKGIQHAVSFQICHLTITGTIWSTAQHCMPWDPLISFETLSKSIHKHTVTTWLDCFYDRPGLSRS